MPTYNSSMFYLGNFADMDPNEANFDAEGAANFLGTYTTPNLMSVVVNDNDGVFAVNDNEFGNVAGDNFVYDAGSGTTTQYVDSTIVYNVRVTMGDNSTIDILATAVQLENGDTFLTDYGNGGSLDNLNVQSIELLSVFGSSYNGFWSDSSVDNTTVVCFAEGTMIDTRAGPVAIEALQVGMEVRTQDHGWQPLRWVGARRLRAGGKDAPVNIPPGTLAPGMPQRTLRVSPQHRVLVRCAVARRMFGAAEVFVKAKALLDLPGIACDPSDQPVTYWHLAFESHEVIWADGAPAESLFPGPMSLAALSVSQKLGLVAALGSLKDWAETVQIARPCPSLSKQRRLLERCLKNRRSLYDGKKACRAA